MARLLIREEADADIDAIARFIAKDNLAAGQRCFMPSSTRPSVEADAGAFPSLVLC
jgi:hypothetical protein